MTHTSSKSAVIEGFQAKDFSNLYGIKGFSDEMLSDHFKLYQGYVKKTNQFIEELGDMVEHEQTDSPAYGELKRRFGWEYNSVKLHELYFGNLKPSNEKSDGLHLVQHLMDDFLKTGETRGIGWVVMYKDSVGRLINAWIDEHNNGHLICNQPVLVLDVFEHAFMTDYGLDRKKYIANFYEQINWKVVEDRLRKGASC